MSRPFRLRPAAGAVAFGFALAALTAAPATAHATADEIIVFAAASLADAMAEVEMRFEAATGHEVIVSLAASSALARQIRHGAPAGIFISSSTEWMDAIEAEGLIEPGSRFDLLGNAIVLVASGAEAEPVEIAPGFDLAGLLSGARPGGGRLAMALVDAAPVGIYGKAALHSLGVWAAVEPQVAQADNARAALALVARGEAPYGIVYATDAAAVDAVTVVGVFPSDAHPPILYPAARLANRGGAAEAAFLAHLRGPEAREVFERLGFAVIAR